MSDKQEDKKADDKKETPKEPTPDALKRLAKLGTCAISDALIKLQVKNGGYVPDVEMMSPSVAKQESTTICGPAYTVKLVSATDSDSPKLDKGTHWADAAPKDSIMVVTAPDHVKNACWGGLATVRAQKLGVKGVVIDGRCRDLKEHRDLSFPVFARGHSTLGQSTFVRASEVGETIHIHARKSGDDPVFPSIEIANGYYVVGDLDGVVVIPPEQINDVVETAEQLGKADANVLADLKKGTTIAEAFKKHRQE